MSTVLTNVDEDDLDDLEAALSAFLDEYESSQEGFRFLLRHPRRTAQAIAAAGRMPVLRVEPTPDREGAAVRRELSRGDRPLRTPLHALSGAIRIPSDPDAYDQGSGKQTLRRKIRAAQKAGVTWESVDDPAERRRLIDVADAYERINPRERYRASQPDNLDLLDYDLWLVARTADGSPLLLSVTPVADGVGALRYFRVLSDAPEGSDARYLMTWALVRELADRRVHHLVDTTIAMHLSHGLRHFQRMVGFRIVRLQID